MDANHATFGTNAALSALLLSRRPTGNNSVRAIVSVVLLLMPGEITRLRLIENRRELGSLKDNGAFLLSRWPGTIEKSDSLRGPAPVRIFHFDIRCGSTGIYFLEV